MPHLDDIQNDYDTAQVRIITISDDDWATIKSYARGSPCLYLRDASNSVWSLYRQGGYIPLNYVICPDQTVKDWMEGFSESQIRSWIDQCLPGVEEGSNRQLAMDNGQLSIHPNPFVGFAEVRGERRKVRGNVGAQGNALLHVYDLAGRLVEETDGSVIGERLEAGVYFVKVKGCERKKVVKLR